MRQIFKLFFSAERTRPWLVLACLLLGGFAEAIGIGSLLPVAGAVLQQSGKEPSAFEGLLQSAFQAFNITPTFGGLIVLVIAIMVIRCVLLFAAMSYASITSVRVGIMLRRRLINAILNARWSYYANQSVGALANNISTDASRASEAYMLFATAAACTIQILAYAVIALMINYKVAIAGILAGFVISIFSGKLVRVSKVTGFKISDRISELTTELVEMLGNMKAMKSMHRYAAALAHVDKVVRRLKRSSQTQSYVRYGLVYGNDLLVSLMVGLGAYAAHTYANVALSEMFVIGVLFFQVVSYASKLQKQMQAAAQYHGAYERLAIAIGNAEAEREENPGTLQAQLGNGIAARGITFKHSSKDVLQNLSLDVPANLITVIQGPSGAGKTTLIDLLVGFHRPASGQIMIGDVDLNSVDLHDWRNQLGYVPQELAMFHDSVKANITLHDDSISEQAVQTSLRLAGVDKFLDQLPNGLDTDVGEFGGKLSGGQRQRISLARALVTGPRLLILDEVTSALDPETEAAIVKNIADLRGQFTIVAITHRPAWTNIADRLYTLKNGKAVLQKPNKKKRA